jgi:hypothetical protein
LRRSYIHEWAWRFRLASLGFPHAMHGGVGRVGSPHRRRACGLSAGVGGGSWLHRAALVSQPRPPRHRAQAVSQHSHSPSTRVHVLAGPASAWRSYGEGRRTRVCR